MTISGNGTRMWMWYKGYGFVSLCFSFAYLCINFDAISVVAEPLFLSRHLKNMQKKIFILFISRNIPSNICHDVLLAEYLLHSPSQDSIHSPKCFVSWVYIYLPTIMMTRNRPMQPMIIIIFILAHHCFRFNLPACCSNCEAPCCKASARWSNSVNFWSRSKTFSTLTRIMPTTSSTWACVCCNRLFAGFVPPTVLLFGGGGNVGILIRLILFIDHCSMCMIRMKWVSLLVCVQSIRNIKQYLFGFIPPNANNNDRLYVHFYHLLRYEIIAFEAIISLEQQSRFAPFENIHFD